MKATPVPPTPVPPTPASGPQPAPWLRGVAPYRPPRHDARIDLALDGNEGATPPAALLDALAVALPDVLRRYPSALALQEAWAARLGVAPEGLLVTAGADEALERTLRAFLAPGRELVLPVPTFEMLPRYARAAGATVREVAWPDGPFPTGAVLDAVTPATSVIAVVTPNNPTGAVAAAGDIARLAAAAPHAVVLVDLAYVEFADEDPTAAALALPNAIVARTLSKAWGLAGLRVGCAAGPPGLIDALRAAGSPYTVAAPSLALAEAWLAGGASAVDGFVAAVRSVRARVSACLAAGGAAPLASQANFVFARFANAAVVKDRLAARGIAVRAFAARGLEDALRITCPGAPADADRLCAALTEALTENEEKRP